MNKTAAVRISRKPIFAAVIACTLAGGGFTTEQIANAAPKSTAAATSLPPVTPAMTYLAHLPADKYGELALGKLFAAGTATYVPVGDGTGFPVLFHSVPELNFLASQLWGGKTFRVTSGQTQPNGDPIVRLDNKIIKTPEGGLFNLFNAYVTRNLITDEAVGKNSKGEVVPPPVGALAPAKVSFLKEPVVIDDKPSIWLNYFEDKTLPIIRRILDEIREVDAVNCPGLFLGRAHVRRCTTFNCGEAPSIIVDSIESFSADTRYQWNFWTYFILNFGQPAGSSCDIGAAVAKAEAALQSEGYDVALPATPVAQ
jgi:hypothetical protein